MDIRKRVEGTFSHYESINDRIPYTLIAKLRNIQPNEILALAPNFCALERFLIASKLKGKKVNKPFYQAKFGLTSRMYNLADNMAEAKIASAKECSKLELEKINKKIEHKLVDYAEAVFYGNLKELPGTYL